MTKQPELGIIEPERLWADTMLFKTRGLLDDRVWENLSKCGKESLFKTCRCCGKWETFEWKCNLKFCPLCNWRIARRRADMLKVWSLIILQPKHVVLTARNSEQISRERIRFFQQAFAKLRRTKLWKPVKGGCISMEITNEGRGWHLHAHILCDVRFIDAGQLAKEWGRLVGQDFAIVKVKDVRGKDYLGEVTKYVAKGSEIAGWTGEDIAAFIGAIRGIRFFASFGSMFKMSKDIKLILSDQKPPAKECECGSLDFMWEDERQATINQIRKDARR